MLRSIVVFSHLRWDSVFQRPQQLVSRFARKHDVWFVEEPIHEAAQGPSIALRKHGSGLTICQPLTDIAATGFNSEQNQVLRRLLSEVIGAQVQRPMAAWLYTPMAVDLARAMQPDVTIYDCMDELTAFMHAPPELTTYEGCLLLQADAVFTGGPSLYAAKCGRHHSVYCFPSSVDVAHFRSAGTMSEALDQRDLPRPRFGFFGVIDERFDRSLVDSMACTHPDWQIVLVGPVVKINPADLPRRRNIHYMGARTYAELPSYVAGWDVCMMPFAHNEATRFISPTKTLEYMAAERPIASTSIRDVAEPYGNVVHIGDGAEFVAACERALREDGAQWHVRRERMRAIVSHTSWNATADAMLEIVEQHIGSLPSPRSAAVLAEVRP